MQEAGRPNFAIPVESVIGSLKIANDADITIASWVWLKYKSPSLLRCAVDDPRRRLPIGAVVQEGGPIGCPMAVGRYELTLN